MCGEKNEEEARFVRMMGSPPRVRGEALQSLHTACGRRITPACAGRSSPARTARRPRKDHPRVCGEKMQFAYSAEIAQGSPPRVRGEGRTRTACPMRRRITPACAGRRKPARRRSQKYPDHPRVCGEKLVFDLLELARRGSPPRVRGEERRTIVRRRKRRITPACAGRSRRFRR